MTPLSLWRRARRTPVITLAACLAHIPCHLVVALEPPSTAPGPAAGHDPPSLEVELDPAIPDASELSEWIHKESSEALAELPPSATRRGIIRVSVAGALYDYDVSIITLREGSTEEQTTTWPCECTNDDLLARIRTDVQAAAKALDEPTSAPVGTPAPPPKPERKPGLFDDLQPRGKVGLGLMAGGAIGTVAGIALLGVGKRTLTDPEDFAYRFYKDYRVPGVPTLLLGLGLLATGTTLFVLDRRHLRERSPGANARPLVSADSRGLQFGLMGSF